MYQSIPVHCTVLFSIHQVHALYIIQVPIHQASSDPCPGRPSARCWGWGWGRGVRYWTISSQKNRSGSGGSGSAGTFTYIVHLQRRHTNNIKLCWFLKSQIDAAKTTIWLCSERPVLLCFSKIRYFLCICYPLRCKAQWRVPQLILKTCT
jgi:hypothetical protein